MNDEIMDKMDLVGVYYNEIYHDQIETKKYYVYLIETQESYYVGYTSNLAGRIKNHLYADKNNICSGNGKIWILEKLDKETKARKMEKIWIIWFKLNSNCINIETFTYKIKSGQIKTRDIFNSNYKKFIDNDIISGIHLLNKINLENNKKSNEEFFGKDF
jgi:hypothetical protein